MMLGTTPSYPFDPVFH